MNPVSHAAALSKVVELQDLCDLRGQMLEDQRRVLTETRASIAEMVADRARQYEDGPISDDNGARFMVLTRLARDLGYTETIRPRNARALAEWRAERVQACRGLAFLREVVARFDAEHLGKPVSYAKLRVFFAAHRVAWELYGASL